MGTLKQQCTALGPDMALTIGYGGRGVIAPLPTVCFDPLGIDSLAPIKSSSRESEDSSTRNQNGHLYFIECQISEAGPNPIKIGWSASPKFRLAHLRPACPFPLKILVSVLGTAGDEANLHQMFSTCRMRGEWFQPNSKLSAFVDLLIKTGELPFPSVPHAPAYSMWSTSSETMRIRAHLRELVRRCVKAQPGERALTQQQRAAEILGITLDQAWRMWQGRGSVRLYNHALRKVGKLRWKE